jgi:hypothetical protein
MSSKNHSFEDEFEFEFEFRSVRAIRPDPAGPHGALERCAVSSCSS